MRSSIETSPLEKRGGKLRVFARNPSTLRRGSEIRTVEEIVGKGQALEPAKFASWLCVFGKAGDSGGARLRGLPARVSRIEHGRHLAAARHPADARRICTGEYLMQGKAVGWRGTGSLKAVPLHWLGLGRGGGIACHCHAGGSGYLASCSRLPGPVMSGCFLSPEIVVGAQRGGQETEEDFPQNRSREG